MAMSPRDAFFIACSEKNIWPVTEGEFLEMPSHIAGTPACCHWREHGPKFWPTPDDNAASDVILLLSHALFLAEVASPAKI